MPPNNEATTDNETSAEDRKMSYGAYILTQIREQSPLTFNDIVSTTFEWNRENGPVQVSAYEMRSHSSQGIAEAITEIEDFLKQEGYAVDAYNSSDGTVVGTRGFIKENDVCRIFMQTSLETGNENLRIACGLIR